jgi:phospholipid/cholesterol/gamma-HCH transport system substrate-binding protein
VALSSEAKVGIMMMVVLILITILVFGVGGMDLFSGGKEIKVLFDSTSGIEQGSAVKLAGVNCGTVKDIDFTDTIEKGKPKTLIVATLKISEKTQVHVDSEIFISSVGILAEKYVNITPGTPGSKLAPADMVFRGKDFGDIPTLISKVDSLAEGLQLSLKGINEILEPQTINDVKDTLSNLSVFTSALKNSSGDLQVSLAQLRGITTQTNSLLTDNKNNFNKTMSDLSLLSDQLLAVTESFDRTSIYLESVSRRLDQGEGSLGKLINRDEVYDDLRLTLAEVQSLLKDIREHPTRYINLSIF